MNILEKYNETEPRYNELMDELEDLFEDEEQPGGGGGCDGGGDYGKSKQSKEQSEEESEEQSEEESKGNAMPLEELTEAMKKRLAKALAKQKDFLSGDVNKTKTSKKDKQQMTGIEHSDASIETIDSGTSYVADHKVVVIRKINEKNRGVCDMYTTSKGSRWHSMDDETIATGFRLGAMLGKKLRVRNDDSKIQYNRQKRGGIDRRLLAELGVGNTKIFEKTYVTSSNDAGIHISIDASGSMGGTRFKNAISTAIAIAKAADMVGGIRVRIDLRSSCMAAGLSTGNYGSPVVLVVYDSKTQNLMHIKKNFGYLSTGGGTPEGICFAAIKDIISQGGHTTDRYFINMSDGAPSSNAIPITKKAVKGFKADGLKVLSYFISDDGRTVNTHTEELFDGMYGKDSTEYVDTTNIVQIAKTLNKLLSERN